MAEFFNQTPQALISKGVPDIPLQILKQLMLLTI